ncbi:dihydroorotate dehydrogenase [Hypoxylon sp. FL0890]|nr:dihydroorotate dehydrogenase [Hypoxylon sp. FL0890]
MLYYLREMLSSIRRNLDYLSIYLGLTVIDLDDSNIQLRVPPEIHINPPLLNSANPWATTLEDLKALFECPSTGAVTTRTALLDGFPHDPGSHQYTFFNPATNIPGGRVSTRQSATPEEGANASLNNMGYSPIKLDEYLGYIKEISDSLPEPSEKWFIVSVTGSPDDVATCYKRVCRLQAKVKMPLALELNLSCPNIVGAPPPAYDAKALEKYLNVLWAGSGMMRTGAEEEEGEEVVVGARRVPWGIKTPPYTHAGQFDMLVKALRGVAAPRFKEACPVSFVTATNTLGSCLVLSDDDGDSLDEKGRPRLAGSGVGGMAGAPLHPLALGNVATLRRMLDEHRETRHVRIIGVGGVEDAMGYRRMRGVGAAAVGVGTALGRKGVAVFKEIEGGLGGPEGDGKVGW